MGCIKSYENGFQQGCFNYELVFENIQQFPTEASEKTRGLFRCAPPPKI